MIPVFLFFSSFFLSVFCAFQFNQQGEFTILQLTDLHYCKSSENDANSQVLTRALINSAQPDLIVFTGDAISAGKTNYDSFKACWESFTQPVIEAGIRYAYLLGNHDDDGRLSRVEIVRLDQTNPLSVRSESEGIPDKATFYVPIYSSDDPTNLAANLWMFDSGRYGCHGEYPKTSGCIETDQLDWYDQESQKIKDQHGTNVHHLAFFHIPIPEYLELLRTKEIYGSADEKICCPVVNSGFFERVLKNGDITATFVGHDHYNNFGGWYKGVELVYGQKSGYGGYGTLRGARVIKLKEETNEGGEQIVTREHHIIFENGDIGYTEPIYVKDINQTECKEAFSLKEKSSSLHIISMVAFFMLIIILTL